MCVREASRLTPVAYVQHQCLQAARRASLKRERRRHRVRDRAALGLRTLPRSRAVLTIENYASFNRHVRETSDGALTVYVGGLLSVVVAALLKRLSREIVDVPFLHWGDIDGGVLRIFRHVEECVARPLQPHPMTRKLAEQYGRPCEPDDTLGPIAKSDGAIADLARWLREPLAYWRGGRYLFWKL